MARTPPFKVCEKLAKSTGNTRYKPSLGRIPLGIDHPTSQKYIFLKSYNLISVLLGADMCMRFFLPWLANGII